MILKDALVLGLIGTAFLLPGCGGQQAALGNGNVAIASKAFSTAAGGTAFALPEVTEFKICVASVKLEDVDGKAHVEQEDTSTQSGDSHKDEVLDSSDARAAIKFSPGLIDLSAGKEVNWGALQIPTGFSLSRLKIKVKKDKDKCGVDYSVRFNGREAQEDIEFKWKFSPAVAIDANTSQLTLSLASVISALRSAAEAGSLDHMKDHVEALEDEAQEHGLDDK